MGAAGSGSNTLTIYMNFLNSNTPVTSGYTGYAPQLECASGCFQTSYAQYDNGANVFNNYWNELQLTPNIKPSSWLGSNSLGSYEYYNTPTTLPLIFEMNAAYPINPTSSSAIDLLYSESSISNYAGISDDSGSSIFAMLYSSTFTQITYYFTKTYSRIYTSIIGS